MENPTDKSATSSTKDNRIINAQALFKPESDDTEQQGWIDRAKQGDQQAFYQLYQCHHRRIYALCWRMMADKDSAEDVCQEVFVVLWQKISNFRGESKFSTWLHSVATNVVLNHLRKQKNWWQRVFSIEDHPIAEQTTEIPSLEGKQQLAQLDQFILQLPEKARLVFVLFAIEGYRHEEIANMLNMAVGSSKAQYHRAKGLLKKSLTNHENFGGLNDSL